MSLVIMCKEKNGDIVAGADGRITADDYYVETAVEKIFLKDNILWGYVGTIRPGQTIRYRFKTPKPVRSTDYYIHDKLYHSVIECLGKHNLLNDNLCLDANDCLMFAVGGRIFEVDYGMQFIEMKNVYCCGAGDKMAYGMLHDYKGENAEKRILETLKYVSDRFCYVGPPYKILRLKNGK